MDKSLIIINNQQCSEGESRMHWTDTKLKTDDWYGFRRPDSGIRHDWPQKSFQINVRNNKRLQSNGLFCWNNKSLMELQEKSSHWRTQKNGLIQSSVLAPLLSNIIYYTNDQPTPLGTNHTRICADDLSLTAQNSFDENLTIGADHIMSTYVNCAIPHSNIVRL